MIYINVDWILILVAQYQLLVMVMFNLGWRCPIMEIC